MDNRRKNALYSLALILAVAAVWIYRNNLEKDVKKAIPYITIAGEAQGTTYGISYKDPSQRDFKKEIDSLLLDFDKSLSTYRPDSRISAFNQENIDSLAFNSPYFYEVLKTSQEVYKASNGAFDPTIYPLINAWGFGKNSSSFPDTSKIRSIKSEIGFDKINFNKEAVWTENSSLGLNFNAIAQGYAIDVLYDFLVSKGIGDLMIELGGEVRVKGENDRQTLWSIGIDNPDKTASSKRSAIIKLKDEAMSTSGNYRNFFVHEGITYGHTIDPRTGFPVQRDIISATVVAPNCMLADAWSTVFMVVGLEEAKSILAKQKDLKAFLIYQDEDGKMQQYFSDKLEKRLILAD